MKLDADVLVIALGMGALAYGIYSRSKLAGYEATPPPVLAAAPAPVAPPMPTIPGIPQGLLAACSTIVDAPGGTLAGPLAPRGMEPDRVRDVIDELIRRMRLAVPALDLMCTAIGGGSCMADADGAAHFVVTWMMYERTANVSMQLVSGVIALEDGTYRVTAMDLATQPDPVPMASGHDPAPPAPYTLPISPEI